MPEALGESERSKPDNCNERVHLSAESTHDVMGTAQ